MLDHQYLTWSTAAWSTAAYSGDKDEVPVGQGRLHRWPHDPQGPPHRPMMPDFRKPTTLKEL